MSSEDFYIINSSKSEAAKANEALIIRALDDMEDSQFLNWLALMNQEGKTLIFDYIVERLTKISLILDAYESMGGNNAS